MNDSLTNRNEGCELDVDWVMSQSANTSAIERRAATLGTRRSIKKAHQAAWLLKAISCIDLTTLSGDDTAGRVKRLCAKGIHPIRPDLTRALGMDGLHVGAICVYHEMIETAIAALGNSGIPVAAVSTGFPAGLSPFKTRLLEIDESVLAGAKEIDIVISRRHVLTQNWQELFNEVKAFRSACGDAHLKTILATGELGSLRNVARASMVCMMAGADFIKTSTGKESINATLGTSIVMVRAIREYWEKQGLKWVTNQRVAYQSKDALVYLSLIKEELGNDWMDASLFRFGASSLLGDIERQLEHYLTGNYSANYRHPLG